MPPKRSAAAAAIGGGPVAASQSPKRVKVSADYSGGKQRKLEAFFTSPTKPKAQGATTLREGRDSGALERPRERPRPQEVIVIDDEAGGHQVSTCLPSEHSNERTSAAGNGSDCGAGPIMIPATSMMEEDRLGVRGKDENNRMKENGVDTDILLARSLTRAGRIDIQRASKLQSGSQIGTNRLRIDGLGSPSNPSPIVRATALFTVLHF